MKILIVDDDLGTRTLVKRIAQQSAKSVVEASNGLEALSLIEREDPDMVITDLRMPLLDGFELVAALRGSATHAAVPIICLTSVDQRNEIARLVEAGITDYVLKPVKPLELTDRIKRAALASANWRNGRKVRSDGAGVTSLLIIDADATFRSFVRGQLATEYEIVEAANAAEGLRQFNERATKPGIVFIAETLTGLSHVRTAELLRNIAGKLNAPAPRVFAIVEGDEPSTVTDAAIEGSIRRSFVPAQFLAAVHEAVGSGPSDTASVQDQVLRDAHVWLPSAARRAFGVTVSKEIEIVGAESVDASGFTAASASRVVLPEGGQALRVRLSSSADHASAVAPTVSAEQTLGALIDVIGAGVNDALAASGVAAQKPVRDKETAAAQADATPAVTIGVRTPEGQLFVLTLAIVAHVVPPSRPAPRPAPEPEPEPAVETAPAETTAEAVPA